MADAATVVHARSTDTFGRVLAQARHHHVVVDGPERNGCPGEALGPAELFLGGVATCGVELVQVLARAEGVEVGRVAVTISGEIDRERTLRPDVTLFSRVRLEFALEGVGDEDAARLVEAFKGR